uniref:NADH-ubiquinone oxidoreductase chain 4 n=1 Tax=Thaumamermis cosgrovei TaxID=382538 RepID=Q1HBD6_THACS|nr:NADH dehydrogenase subunit 4 [Thaumamermis cosgrovei]ABF48141.1 NADH dehydrogenase subunit 4 [Thaumamermis cosgrovei]ABF48153.1 NADH dehydrogenase subunit 4 [Thaumamermis cosgrovei]
MLNCKFNLHPELSALFTCWMLTSWWFMFSKLLISVLFIIWLVLKMVWGLNFNNKLYTMILGLIIVLFLVTDYLWKFYMLFELSMIPMLVLILGYGINLSRLMASFYMLMYMLIFSFPMLSVILINMCLSTNLLVENWNLNIFTSYFTVMPFLTKCPMFGLHLWLPKAHVEASTTGSMILAAGLLKMGTYGLMKLMFWNAWTINNTWLLLGMVLSVYLCSLQSDFKKLVAYSSVAHMSMSIIILNLSIISFISMVMINLSHTLISSCMFYFSGLMSALVKSRLIFFMSTTILTQYILFCLMLMNLSVPPMVSFISEYYTISSIFIKSHLSVLTLLLFGLISLMYTSMLYNFMNFNYNKMKQISITSLSLIFWHFCSMMYWLVLYYSEGLLTFFKNGGLK